MGTTQIIGNYATHYEWIKEEIKNAKNSGNKREGRRDL